ncbi:MAG: nitronate monooxygenase [Bdellovibrionota bacterium]
MMKSNKTHSTTRIDLSNDFTKLLGCKYPIIAGPMFLLSDEALVIAACRAGIVGAYPALNWRTTEGFREATRKIKSQIGGLPFAVNIIVNKSNIRVPADLRVCLDEGVPLFITSLGSPKEVIAEAHKNGAKVFCDVTTLDYAKKVQDLGADGVIAVSSGAGGHAGPISPMVLVPYLRKHLSIPVVAAGGIASGRGLAAALVLGAAAAQIGTRFIASTECKADQGYKNAILNADPEDIVLTPKISGTPAAVIKTPYVEKLGLELNVLEKLLLKDPRTKKWFKLLVSARGAKLLGDAAKKATWKEVWSAGQGVGLIDDIKTIQEIVDELVDECVKTLGGFCMPGGTSDAHTAKPQPNTSL